jgi:stage V sporulation protein D (sporulation-specific penicillin-binding protein)
LAAPSLTIKRRLLTLLFLFSVMIAGLVVRLAWLQIVQGEEFQKMAFEQQNSDRIISPRRGTIFDRNGKPLAISASVETISANPQVLKKSKKPLEEIAAELGTFLEMDTETVLKKVQKASRYEWIKRKVDKEAGDQVRQWRQENNLDGIYIDEDTKRFYPNRNLAAHVIGFTGYDNQGLDGIEAMMEQYLKGVPGKILSEVDASGYGVPFKEEKHIDPQDGLNAVLTIDETIQYLAEKALEKAIDENKVLNGAAAIIIDPRNGEVLALSSKPDFDLNDPRGKPEAVDAAEWDKMSEKDKITLLQKTVWRNKPVVDTYEPGSTFKAITSAAGLEEGVIKPDSPVTDATVTVGGWRINCWKPNYHLHETFTEGVYNSCNPVFVRVSQSLGVDRFYKYVRAFGFFDKTGIDLPGESRSVIHKKPTEIDMATASFGQSFQISPIQLISAYGAIANGGKLIKPHVVKELTDEEGNVVKKFEPEVVRNVVSSQTAETLREILEGVVSKGTGGRAYVKGFRVAGKTGTSETVESRRGIIMFQDAIHSKRYIASFMSFAPADNPVICALIILDYPDVYPHTGGWIAAPVAGKLVEDVLNYLEVEREYSDMDKELMLHEVTVPDVRNLTVEDAVKQLKEKGLEYKVEGNGNNKKAKIVEQTPKPAATVQGKSVVILYTSKTTQEVMVRMPDLSNKTVAEATDTLNSMGLNIKVSGLGIAVKQRVESGKSVKKGEIVEVEFGSPGAE